MSKQTCYSIARSHDDLVVLAVDDLGDGRWQVAEPVRFAAEAGPPPKLARALNRNRSQVAWLLTEEEASVSTTTLPRLKPRQLKSVVKGWVVREQGGALDDWIVDWQPLDRQAGAGEADKQAVAVTFARREIVAGHLDRARAWGLAPGAMLPDFLALDLFFRRFGPDVKDLQGWNLVFLGKRQRFLCIGTGTHLLLTRTLPVDLSDGGNPEEYLDQLATEIERSGFFARQTHQSPEIGKVVVCGDPYLAGNLTRHMGDRSAVPVEPWDLAGCFTCPTGPLEADHLLAAAAAVLAGTRLPLNLAPDQRRTLLGPLARQRALVAVGTLATAAVPLLLIGGLVTTEVQDRYLDRARERLAAAQIEADEAAQVYRRHGLLLAQEDYIRDISLTTPDFEQVLLRLANLTPAGIVYRDLQLKQGGSGGYRLRLAGVSNASSSGAAQATFLDFLAALQGCAFLSPLGEPTHVEITTQDEEGVVRKQVVFSLDYSVLPARPGAGG